MVGFIFPVWSSSSGVKNHNPWSVVCYFALLDFIYINDLNKSGMTVEVAAPALFLLTLAITMPRFTNSFVI